MGTLIGQNYCIPSIFLLVQGLNLNDTDDDKNTGLALLLKTVARYKRQEKLSAEIVESYHMIWYILDLAVSRATDSLNVANSDGDTPLYIACEAHMPKTLKLLIEKGADVMCKCDDGKNTLMHVCCCIEGTDRCSFLYLLHDN